MNKDDMELLIRCAKMAGASVTIADNGKGGIYVNGREITDIKEFFEDFFERKSEE